MKTFFSSFFGALFGVIVSTVLAVIIVIAMVTASIKSAIAKADGSSDSYTISSNSILHLNLVGKISERAASSPLDGISITNLKPEKGTGLNELLANIKKAKTDNNIKGIYLTVQALSSGMATLEEVRNALLDFKTSKKFIYAYAEGYSQSQYYLASVADKIYLNPQGILEFKGLAAQIMFYKNALEKLDVDVQIFRHGKFKSAIEPFDLDKMSDANRLQTYTYISSMWNHALSGISKSRNISVEELNSICDNLKIRNAKDALGLKLIDGLMYEDEAKDELKKALKVDADAKLNLVGNAKYVEVAENKVNSAKDKIAIIYAVGEIESGEGDDNTIGSARIAKAIRDARLDKNIKAIVLRVNSPGGSSLASDVMWREVVLAKKAKPFVVSMGDVAASGGYYISCAADRIFAQPNTITGSIGVFGMIPNFKNLLNNKLGITIDTVKTNKHSDVGTQYRPTDALETAYIQQSVEEVYNTFIGRVAEGRHTKPESVDSIGQGRVWSGIDALKINLVDEIGGINEAVAYAAKLAKISDYKTTELPKQLGPLSTFLKDAQGDVDSKILERQLGEKYEIIKHFKKIMNTKGVQARMTYDVLIQ